MVKRTIPGLNGDTASEDATTLTPSFKVPTDERDLATISIALRPAAIELGRAIDAVNDLDARYDAIPAEDKAACQAFEDDEREPALLRRKAAQEAFVKATKMCHTKGAKFRGRIYVDWRCSANTTEDLLDSCDVFDLDDVIDLDAIEGSID